MHPRPPSPHSGQRELVAASAGAVPITLTLFLRLLMASLCEKEGKRSREGDFRPSWPWTLQEGQGPKV